MEYLVRQARITDIDRFYALCAQEGAVPGGDSPIDAIGLMRQLVYLPNASVALVESNHQLAGGAVLGLRPSVRSGGFVGTVDLLVVDPRHDADRVTDVLLEEVLRSARNKACAVVEAAQPDDPAERTRWERQGFTTTGPRITRSVAAARAAVRRI